MPVACHTKRMNPGTPISENPSNQRYLTEVEQSVVPSFLLKLVRVQQQVLEMKWLI